MTLTLKLMTKVLTLKLMKYLIQTVIWTQLRVLIFLTAWRGTQINQILLLVLYLEMMKTVR